MKQKLKDLFDSRTTWATIGVFAGSLFGDKVALIINGVGAVVMAVL